MLDNLSLYAIYLCLTVSHVTLFIVIKYIVSRDFISISGNSTADIIENEIHIAILFFLM